MYNYRNKPVTRWVFTAETEPVLRFLLEWNCFRLECLVWRRLCFSTKEHFLRYLYHHLNALTFICTILTFIGKHKSYKKQTIYYWGMAAVTTFTAITQGWAYVLSPFCTFFHFLIFSTNIFQCLSGFGVRLREERIDLELASANSRKG